MVSKMIKVTMNSEKAASEQTVNSAEETRWHAKSWKELFDDVRLTRRKLWSVAYRVPGTFTFRKMGKLNSTRIYFLSCPPLCRENCIYAVEIPDDAEAVTQDSDRQNRFVWIDVLDVGNKEKPPMGKQEQLMMERKRATLSGITHYEFNEEHGRFILTAGSALYYCDDFIDLKDASRRDEYLNEFMATLPPLSQRTTDHFAEIKKMTIFLRSKEYPLIPKEVKSTKTSGGRLNPSACPMDPDLIAFVNNGDIWVVHAKNGTEVRLTYSGCKNNDISAGLPSYVTQEEFNRYVGFWWRPVVGEDGYYYILYEEVDESQVHVVSLLSMPGRGDIEDFKFPIPGTANAKSRINIVRFRVDENQNVIDISCLDYLYPLYQAFPWTEYIVRIGWHPNGNYYWAQILDRPQKRLELIALPFVTPDEVNNKEGNWRPSCPVYVLYSETSETWINVHDILEFTCPANNGKTIEYIWASEETGYRHLYYVESELRPALEKNWHYEYGKFPLICASPRLIKKRAITNGDWEVIDSDIFINYDFNFVFFTATKETPLERHLYVASFNESSSGELRLLTDPGYFYNPFFSKDCSYVVLNYSNIKYSTASQLFRLKYNGSSIDDIEMQPITYMLDPPNPISLSLQPEIECYKLDSGVDVYAMIIKPLDFCPDKKYPTILNVYGGPDVQLVLNCFRGTSHLWLYLLASQGYCVVSIDSRGSNHRGVQFESHIYQKMGKVELADQIETLQYLANRKGYIDMNRVGINGWSYGGYLSLMGLVQYPDIFKVCVAGAPVTNWCLYDTGYTERYLGLRETNPEGYTESSVISYADQFPDEEGRLMLVHGLNDENVHFIHSAELINALITAGKPYQIMIYPNERHCLRKLEASEHYETGLLSFLQKKLKHP